MNRRTLVGTALAGTLALALAATPASANNVAWSVSIGGPGFAVSAGQPAFVGPARYAYGPAFVAPPVFAPVVAPVAPVAPVVYAAPVVYPIYPRVYVAPRVAYYGGYGRWGGRYYGGHR